MFSILLVIIYIAFISLGLPDALLGSAWPSMYGDMQVPVSYAGIVSMIIAGGTILSSLNSDRLIHRFGTGVVTMASVFMTAAALLGFSCASSFWMLCVIAIPYGLGAGSVDAALNNFVALHYESKHMSWLHCFWGIGATLGPYIMGFFLTRGMSWNLGYRSIFLLQILLTAVLLFSLPLWKKTGEEPGSEEGAKKIKKKSELLKIAGARQILTAFFCYCALEATTGLWASSYMVLHHKIAADVAAKWASIFYLGITIGRFVSGFITQKLGDKWMVRLGQIIAFLGVLILILPLGGGVSFAGLILVGLGCAPIYPSLLHATPVHFGKEVSQSMMGMQMACAYIGSTFMPPLFGFLVQYVNISVYPLFLLIFVVVMIVMSEKMNRSRSAAPEESA